MSRGRHWLAAAALGLLVGPLPPAQATVTARTLYVSPDGADTNPGTAAAPLRTILAASRLAHPGDAVAVAPGLYAGGFRTAASGTALQPIRYRSIVKGRARIVPPDNSASDTAWDNRGAYVAIDGFEVDGRNFRGGRPWRLGLYSAGSHSVIENSTVHDIAETIPDDSTGGAGVEGDSYYGGVAIDLIGNVVHDIGAAGAQHVQGVYESTSGKVMNNLVYRVSGYGIHLWHDASHVLVVNNTVLDNGTGGIVVGGGDRYHAVGPDDDTYVANNIVFRNGLTGIEEDGDTGTHNRYRNNLVYANVRNWALKHGIAASQTVTGDPAFVAEGVEDGDYHLAPRSPAIGAGTAENAPAVDLDGVPRSQGNDIGAYTFVGARRR